jgi:photosystem II stability/assembly factor-like uncharacterized protein
MEEKRTMKCTRICIFLMILVSVLIAGCATAASSTSSEAGQVEAEPVTMAEEEVAPSQAEESSAWEVVLQKEVEQPVRMPAFLNETFGITGGGTGAGKTHYTTDGGDTWTMSEDSGGCIYGVEIVDDQTVWVCGRIAGASFTTEGGIRLSTDGAQTWGKRANYNPRPDLCQLSFLDTQTGWVANVGKLSVTTDGGETWQEITLPEGIATIAAISLLTPSEGYVVDYDGNLYITSDGGANWSSQKTLDLEKYGELKLVPPSNLASVAMRFLDADHGVIVLNLIGGGDNKVVALRTADGGQTWQEESVPAEIGVPYLSSDGKFLTLYGLLNSDVTVLRYGEG